MTNYSVPHQVYGRCPLGDECPCWREGFSDAGLKNVRFLENPAPLHAFGPLPSPYVMRHNSKRESDVDVIELDWVTTLMALGFASVAYRLARKTWHWIRA